MERLSYEWMDDHWENSWRIVFFYAPGVGVEVTKLDTPGRFLLPQNYPNPFSATTTITFTITQAEDVELTAIDLLGRRVANLVSGIQPPGTHVISFDAQRLESGIYFYQLRAGEFVDTRRMILVK